MDDLEGFFLLQRSIWANDVTSLPDLASRGRLGLRSATHPPDFFKISASPSFSSTFWLQHIDEKLHHSVTMSISLRENDESLRKVELNRRHFKILKKSVEATANSS